MLRNGFCVVQFPVICLVSLLLICAQVHAQEEGGEASDSDPAAEKAETPKPEAKPAEAEAKEPAAEKTEAEPPAETAESKPAPATFDAKFAEWKDVLKQLRKLRADYMIAEPNEVAEIERQWDELIAKGEAMIPALRETGTQAYLSAPNEDDQLVDFLVKLVAEDVLNDDCESALVLATLLLENGCEKKELYEPVGMAAFGTNDFDKAEEYLKKAKDEDAINDKAKELIDELDGFKEDWKKEQEIRQKEAEADDLPRVKLTTSKGDIVIELFENEAPGAVGNFISLVEKEYYNGLTFHRVLDGFMAQGGCPRGDGTGGPGYYIKCECHGDNYRKHFRGTLSMAHAGPDTGGSQFFLTFRPTPHLDGKHTAFGRVVEGMELLNKLQRINPEADGPKPEPDKIVTATVVRKRDHDYEPNKVN